MDLRIPVRHEPVKGSRDVRLEIIDDWINSLPLANLGETSRQVYNLLLEINALNIPLEDRSRVLEQLRPTANYVVDALKKHYIGHAFPLSAKSRQVALLAREILAEMATGYKIVIVEVLSGDATRIDSTLLLNALHRALRYLGRILFTTYLVYDPYPAGMWREIHKLYQYAEQSELHLTLVTDHEYALIESSSVCDVYKHILLLALACPYRLRQSEIEQVEHALEPWASHAELITPHGQDTTQALFVATLEQDSPPSYRALQDQDLQDACRLLDTQGLTQVLREEMIQAQERPDSHLNLTARDISPDIMRRLTLVWGVIPKRRFTRTRKYSHALVVMGLSAAHHFISNESVFEPEKENGTAPFQNRAQFTSAPISSEAGRLPEFWELGQTTGTIDWEAKDKQAQKSESAPTPPPYNHQTWKMINISAGGYCLLWANAESTRAQVGELICLQEADGAHMQNWGIGVIRWMKAMNSDGLELGVQMLAPNAIAVAVKISKDGQHFGDYQRCLLVPEIRALQQPAALLLPALTSQTGGIALIDTHGKTHRVSLTKQLENTGAFSQFNFTPLDTSPVTGASSEAENEPRDFNSIWSSI